MKNIIIITILFKYYGPLTMHLPVGYCGLGFGLDFMSYGSFIHVWRIPMRSRSIVQQKQCVYNLLDHSSPLTYIYVMKVCPIMCIMFSMKELSQSVALSNKCYRLSKPSIWNKWHFYIWIVFLTHIEEPSHVYKYFNQEKESTRKKIFSHHDHHFCVYNHDGTKKGTYCDGPMI